MRYVPLVDEHLENARANQEENRQTSLTTLGRAVGWWRSLDIDWSQRPLGLFD
jgi:hypothetical protein